MKATIEAAEPLYRTLRVEIPWEMVSEEVERMYRELAKDVTLKGFRKGKVPRSVLKQRFGKKVEEDVVNRLIQDSYEAAVVQHHLHPVAKPELQRGQMQEGQPYVYGARVEVRPDIELKEYRGIAVERGQPEVKPEMIEEELKQLREQHATLTPVEGRDQARAGDTAILDYAAFRDGKPLKGGERKGYTLELGSGRAIPGFEDQVAGMRVGEQKEFDLAFPKDSSDTDLAGKTLHFRVQLVALKVREVPELNDEFVTDLGDAEVKTVADLSKRAEKAILERERSRLEREAKDKLIDALIARNPFPVPPSLVDRQQEVFVAEMEMMLAQQGMNLSQAGLSRPKMKQDMRDRAERSIRGDLLVAAVAEKEGIGVSDAEIDTHLQAVAEHIGQNLAKVKAQYDEPQRLAELRYRLRRDKVLDYLLGSSNMKDQEGLPGTPPESTAKKGTQPPSGEST